MNTLTSIHATIKKRLIIMIKSNCSLRLPGLIKIRKINWSLEKPVLRDGEHDDITGSLGFN